MGMFFTGLWQELAQLPEVEAIALGGSRAGQNYDASSDYDIYVYVSNLPEQAVREQILDKYCSYMEIHNAFWEVEDDCTLKDGVDIDIVYRSLPDFLQGIENVVLKHQAGTGYTTCMWHNLVTCRILYDGTGVLTEAQNRFDVAYPDELQQQIIAKNRKLLQGMLPSYEGQIKKAWQRQDLVAVNHRIAAFLESYFEIIFALNKLKHPGEKRQVGYALQQARLLPANFQANLDALLKGMYQDGQKTAQLIDLLVAELDKLLPAVK